MCARRRAEQIERHGLFDASAHYAPACRLASIHVGEIEGFPTTVASCEYGVIGVERIDFDVEHPMNGRVRDIRGQRSVELSAGGEDRLPGFAAIFRAINVIVITVSIDMAVERTCDEGLRILCINRNADPAKSGWLGRRLFRSHIGPLIGSGIQFPYCAIGHAPGTGYGAVGNVQIAIRGECRTVRTILRRLVWNRLPGLACISAAKKIGSPEERCADINGWRGFTLSAASGIENHENNSRSLALRGHPWVFARSESLSRHAHIGEIGHSIPARSGVRALPQPIVTRAEVENVAVIGIDGKALSIAAAGFVAS